MKMNTIRVVLSSSILFIIYVVSACNTQAASHKTPDRIILNNPLSVVRTDESFVIQSKDLVKHSSRKVPVLKKNDGTLVPSQIDDLNGDGKWDELAFVYTLQANETDTLNLSWVSPKKAPVFTPRTNVRCGRQVAPGKIVNVKSEYHTKYQMYRYFAPDYPYQMSGVAWENDKIGWRHYLDGRNCRDIYGKKKSYMALDSAGILPNGKLGDNYHKMADWGRDIYSGANSFGLGGIAVLLPNDSLEMLGELPKNVSEDNVDSTVYNLVTQGPVRSIFTIEFFGWEVQGVKVDVHEKVTIWAGSHGYENEVTTNNLPSNCTLVTGILENNNDRPNLQKDYEHQWTGMITHDKQTYNKVWYLGTALLINNKNFESSFLSPTTGAGILKTWCAKVHHAQQDCIKYRIYAAWEIEDSRFTSSEFFTNMIDQEAQRLCHPATLSLQ